MNLFTKIKDFFANLKDNLSLSKALKILGIAILLIGLPAGLYLVQQTQIFKPKAATPKDQIDVLTEQLLEADKKYDQLVSKSSFVPQIASPSSTPLSTSSATPQATTSAVKAETTSREAQDQLNTMKGIAVRRKELLLQKIKDDPQGFLNKATLADKRDQLPTEVRSYVEQKFTASGQLAVVHADDFDNKKSSFDYFIQKGAEPKYEDSYKLYFVKDPPQVLSGSKIQVSGTQLGNQVVVIPLEFRILEQAAMAVQQQRTAVLLINFTDNPNNKPWKAEELRNLIFNAANPNSVNTYYRDNSTNRIEINGNTHGYYTIEAGQCNYFNDYIRWSDLVSSAFAKDVGKSIWTQYNRAIYLLPDNRCDPGVLGRGTLGNVLGFSQTWIYGQQNAGVYEHEIGHNLGVHHASSIDCSVGDYTNCGQIWEYGDLYDVMGGAIADALHLNAPHKVALGLLSEGEQQTVDKSGIYNIKALEDPSPGIKVLKIKKPDTGDFYYISYRQKDSANRSGGNAYRLPSEIINGASIHIWNGDPVRQTKYIRAIYSGPSDLALADGKTFYDKINKISIKQMNHAVSKEQLRGFVNVAVEFKAEPIPTPTPRPAGDQRVFVTITTYTGNLGGLNGADSICQERANVANLGGIWKAWLSDSNTSVSSRLTHYNTPYKRLDGQTIANNWVDLTDGSLQNPIKVTEFGKERTDFISSVWTNTTTAGQISSTAQSCSNWNQASSSVAGGGGGGGGGGGNVGGLGNSASSSNWWTDSGYSSCNGSATLYCFEEIKPASASATIKPPTTPSSSPVACTPCSADINQDGGVDILDYSYLVSCFNKKSTDKNSSGKSCTPADIDGNGIVQNADYTCLQNQYGKSCSQVSLKTIPTPSPTPTPKPVFVCNACSADINKNKRVDIGDYSFLITCYNKKSTDKNIRRQSCVPADINGDGKITGADFSCLTSQFGKKCSK